jgi:hypothetical protein
MGCPDRSSSWTFVLPALNIQHHFLTLESLITPSPYTAELSMNVSSADILCVQKMDHRSHFTVSRVISFLNHFKYSQKLFKWCNWCETYLKQRQGTTEVKQPWISTESWPAWALCTNGLYFLDDPCIRASWIVTTQAGFYHRVQSPSKCEAVKSAVWEGILFVEAD